MTAESLFFRDTDRGWGTGTGDSPDSETPVESVNLQGPSLPGDLSVPPHAKGLVMFAHGSGSSRFSPRNRWVARALHQHGLATLLFDLLTVREAEDRRLVFDIPLLGRRVVEAVRWVDQRPDLAGLRLGLFGASTGAAAALLAAAEMPQRVAAVVSRGGRPDLVMDRLPEVQAPTLLIVGGLDQEVLELNRQAFRRLGAPKRLEVVPGATHLFAEPGALGSVAAFAGSWFEQHFAPSQRP
jgi:dienelactone hydrolase